jgi:5-methylcytosine-specific restriction protein A
MPTRPPRAYAQGQPPRPQPRVVKTSPHASLYNTPEWKQGSKAYRQIHPRCECPEHQGKPDAPKSECVDHTVAHRGNPTLFFDPRNWCAMSWRCHTRKTNSHDGGFGNKVRPTDSVRPAR